ncbi:MAG: metal-sensitive transcriptional regulator [bacterium]|nr:metal-sensitive transcriptional regulator [bacterium]
MNSKFLDKDEKLEATQKLKQIAGRVKGISKMIEEERDHKDILMQISATSESLRSISKLIIKNHLKTCVANGLVAINRAC